MWGAKHAVSLNSATNAIFLTFLDKREKVKIPSMIPPVVINAIHNAGNNYEFYDNVDWVGDSYVLHDFGDYKVVDSAQKLEKNQFKRECNDDDLMIFSFYPTKPVGSCDGGMIVSNDMGKIEWIRIMAMNGMGFTNNNWDRDILAPGYKMYMNSIQAKIAINNFMVYGEKLKQLHWVRNMYNDAFGIDNTSNHLYRINVENRDDFIEFMKKHGVVCGIHYKPMHKHFIYANSRYELPDTELIGKLTASIPFHEALTKTDVDYIIKLIKDFTG